MSLDLYRYKINREYANHLFNTWMEDRFKDGLANFEGSEELVEIVRESFLLGFMFGNTVAIGEKIDTQVKAEEAFRDSLLPEEMRDANPGF
jgi:hypothetical protein